MVVLKGESALTGGFGSRTSISACIAVRPEKRCGSLATRQPATRNFCAGAAQGSAAKYGKAWVKAEMRSSSVIQPSQAPLLTARPASQSQRHDSLTSLSAKTGG